MKPKVAIFGGGPAAMIAAYFLYDKFQVTIVEKEKNIGQKFLVAGKGGFNITNSLDGDELIHKYYPSELFENPIKLFGSQKLQSWLNELGIKTFVGTSKRVFVSDKVKPAEVLTIIKSELEKRNVKILTNHKFVKFNEKATPIIDSAKETKKIIADYYIFDLGGASWSITGSDGNWINSFKEININTIAFQASNCGVNINWNEHTKKYHLGKPLKNIKISINDISNLGEVVITEYGLEGSGIYPLISEIRKELYRKNFTEIFLDFKPHNSKEELHERVKSNNSIKELLNLTATENSLIKSFTTKDEYLDNSKIIHQIKNLKIRIDSLRPIEEAISTVGGIEISELNKDLSFKKYPHMFAIGEMVDWDAPTGGFLLQGCFSMGFFVAHNLLNRIEEI